MIQRSEKSISNFKMSKLKKLAGQTVIYGVSSILARFLNFMLTPFYTSKGMFSAEQFGVITEMYAYVAFLIIFLTYGMETTFFRYTTKKEIDSQRVYSNILYSVTCSSFIFIFIAILFSQTIANWLGYSGHAEYVVWFAIIVALDALSAIPQAKLRKESKAKKFALINVVNVAVNIGFNLFFLVYCKSNFEAGNTNWLINLVYNEEIGVGYVFISNLMASVVKFLLLGGELNFKGVFDWGLLKEMYRYAYPMLFVGLAFNINEMLDRVMLKDILTNKYLAENEFLSSQDANQMALTKLGIYGANYKIAMIISLFLQAYRYAAEPFFFNQEKEKNATKTYAKVMNFFMIIVCTMFLAIAMNLQIVKYFTPNSDFWVGLGIVPIILAANVMLGVYVNQSIWYKLSSKTAYGALISIAGALITITINLLFIPAYGYMASAWATFICYSSMTALSYYLGQKHYPIPYNLRKLGLYGGLAMLFFFIRIRIEINAGFNWVEFIYNNVLTLVYISVVIYFEKSLRELVQKKLLKRN